MWFLCSSDSLGPCLVEEWTRAPGPNRLRGWYNGDPLVSSKWRASASPGTSLGSQREGLTWGQGPGCRDVPGLSVQLWMCIWHTPEPGDAKGPRNYQETLGAQIKSLCRFL